MRSLKRYTQLPNLLDLLRTKTVTVLSPRAWDDRNDSYFLTKYAERKKLPSILALCLTDVAATYHHWHVFAPNSSGVRIQFNPTQFATWAKQIPGALLKPVKYVKLDNDAIESIRLSDLPFVKRHAFRHEGEVRLIIESQVADERVRRLPFDPSMIEEVIVSPWLPAGIFESVRESIENAAGDAKFHIRPTTMLESPRFKRAAANDA